MNDEGDFKKIPGFSKYKINTSGEVVKIDTETSVKVTGQKHVVNLWADSGVRKQRTIGSLMGLVYPGFEDETSAQQDLLNGPYAPGAPGRRLITEFPSYEIDKFGRVFSRYTGEEKALLDEGRGLFYWLYHDGKAYKRGIQPLTVKYFPESGSKTD